MEKFAIIYDFDYNLSTKNSFEFSLFPSYGINNDSEFMNNIEEMRKECNFEMILSFLYVLVKMAKQHGKPITKEILYNAGKDIEFYKSVFNIKKDVEEQVLYEKICDRICEKYGLNAKNLQEKPNRKETTQKRMLSRGNFPSNQEAEIAFWEGENVNEREKGFLDPTRKSEKPHQFL